MKIFFNKYTGDKDRVNKDSFLDESNQFIVNGIFKEPTDVTNPTFQIEYDGNDFPYNYAKIPTLKRDYFVTNKVMVRHNLFEITLGIDILSTCKDVIIGGGTQGEGFLAFVERAEDPNLVSEDIIDSKMVVKQGQDIEIIPLPNELFINNQSEELNYSFYLTGYDIKAIDF